MKAWATDMKGEVDLEEAGFALRLGFDALFIGYEGGEGRQNGVGPLFAPHAIVWARGIIRGLTSR